MLVDMTTPTRTQRVAERAIHVHGLTKSFADVEVLRGVDLDVAPGSIVALLGSNGAGKTTTIRILATLLKADSGTATVNGYDVVTQAHDVRASISLTGQFAAVDDILTGRENLAWSPACVTCGSRGASPTRCSPASPSPTPADAGSRPTPEACGVGSTSP